MLLFKALLVLVSLYGLDAQTHNYKIVCYLTNWAQYRPNDGKWQPYQTDPNLCTHLMYSFAKLTNGQLAMYEWNDDVLYKQATDLKQRNPNLKVLLAVGGWNMGSTDFSNMVATDASIDTFVRTSVSFLKQWNFDGLDLDWEYPGVGAGSRPTDKARFTLLCQKLKAAFKIENLLLTAAVAAGKGTIDTAYDIPAIAKELDFLNVMTYDYHGQWDRVTGANAPLNAHPNQAIKEFNIDFTIKYYIQGGFPADKIILGMGTYGRSFRLANANAATLGSAAVGGGTAGTYTRETGFLSYYEICRALSNGWRRDYDFDTETPYAHQNLEWVSYDDEISLAEKIGFLKANNLGGAMFWALDLDDFSGSFCNKGPYPLINYVKAALTGGLPPTTGATTRTTTIAGQTTTQSFTTSQPSSAYCQEPNGLFPHPDYCSQFINCANGVAHFERCPGGLYFNSITKVCDWPANVNCNGKPPK